jgi:hypothetical protein
VLDLGMSRRLFTGAVRRVLVLRDGGCAFPSCDRPARWAECHHVLPWSSGGQTCQRSLKTDPLRFREN